MNMLLVNTPLGPMAIAEENEKITRLFLRAEDTPANALQVQTPLLKQADNQLQEYFAGIRKTFDLPLAPKGTPFQLKVWQALLRVPYAQTRSYGQLAAQIGQAKACRAVGMANNKNPLPIFIPCHRVIGAGGKLIGYAGGLPMKEFLLALERKNS